MQERHWLHHSLISPTVSPSFGGSCGSQPGSPTAPTRPSLVVKSFTSFSMSSNTHLNRTINQYLHQRTVYNEAIVQWMGIKHVLITIIHSDSAFPPGPLRLARGLLTKLPTLGFLQALELRISRFLRKRSIPSRVHWGLVPFVRHWPFIYSLQPNSLLRQQRSSQWFSCLSHSSQTPTSIATSVQPKHPMAPTNMLHARLQKHLFQILSNFFFTCLLTRLICVLNLLISWLFFISQIASRVVHKYGFPFHIISCIKLRSVSQLNIRTCGVGIRLLS